MKNKTIIGMIFTLIIIAGIVMTCIYGLNFNFNYSNHKEIDIYIGQEFENQDIYQIAKEVFENKEITVQKVELYEDMVSISVDNITDEELTNLNTKINEKYNIENTVESIEVTDIANVILRDLIKPYILPVAISFAIIIIYIAIYNEVYKRKGREVNNVKTLLKTIVSIIGVQLVYISLLAITRVEVNRLTLPAGIALYIITTIVILVNLENKYSKIKEK